MNGKSTKKGELVKRRAFAANMTLFLEDVLKTWNQTDFCK